MEKIEEIRAFLRFYMHANSFKEKLFDEMNNYSIADNIFGSMILAIAMDSEYKESQNMGKTLRMIFLNEFGMLSPNFKYDCLKLSKQFESEIKDSFNLESDESKLIFKYKSLDLFLTKLISMSKKDNDDLNLFRDAKKVFVLFGNEDEKKMRRFLDSIIFALS